MLLDGSSSAKTQQNRPELMDLQNRSSSCLRFWISAGRPASGSDRVLLCPILLHGLSVRFWSGPFTDVTMVILLAVWVGTKDQNYGDAGVLNVAE